MKRVMSIAVALSMILVAMTVIAGTARASTPMIWTEWGDYHPGETVKIFGDGFAGSAQISVEIELSGSLVNSGIALSDDSGAFVYEFTLQSDAATGEYLVTATDGMVVASTTFMDANDFWLQGSNDGLAGSKPDGIPDGTAFAPLLEWVSGDVGPSKIALTEGNFPPTYPPAIPGHVDYRAILDNLPAGDYTWIIKYQFTKGGKVAFDFLTTSYGITDASPLFYNDLDGATYTAIKNLVDNNISSTMKFPNDPFPLPLGLGGGTVAMRQAAHDAAFGPYNVLHNPVRSLRMYGATITGIVQNGHTGDVTRDTNTTVTVSFHKDSGSSAPVMATWGGHIAIGRAGNQGYGPGNGATGISGSPYHMVFGGVYDSLGEPAIPSGKHDLSLKAESVVVGSISGKKFNDLNNNGALDAGEPGLPGWTITLSGGPITVPPAVTAADGSYSFTDLPAGTYTVSEVQQPLMGWVQTYPVSPGTWTVTIDVDHTSNLDKNFGNFQHVTPTVVTTIKPSSTITLGTTVHDEVQVTGQVGLPGPTGNVQFYLDGVLFDTVAIDASGFAMSKDYTPTTVGAHTFYAIYLGDGVYDSEQSADEPLSMNKHDVSVTTEIKPSSTLTLGETVYDTVQVTGGLGATFAQPTGNVQFYLDGVAFGSQVAIDSSGYARSDDFTPSSVGTHTFDATYLGDSNYKTGTSADEPLSMEKHGVTVVTTIMPSSSITLGDTVHDEVQVTGLLAPFAQPTGDVQFYLDGVLFDTVAIDSSGFAESKDYTPLTVGSHTFYAIYLGDSNYKTGTSADEPLSMEKHGVTVTTTIMPSSTITLGDTVHDEVQVTGLTSPFAVPTGDVQFYLDSEPFGAPVAISASGWARSLDFTPLSVGSHTFYAVYLGDSNYKTGTSADEPLSMNPATPTVVTTIVPSSSITLGDTVHDEVAVTGLGGDFAAPTGKVQFYLDGSPYGAEVTLVDGKASSIDFTPLTVGSHTFYAVYLGDGNYVSVQSADEPLSMEKHGVTVTTTIVPSSSITLGDTVHDEVQVTGLASPFAQPTGDVQFYLDGSPFGAPVAINGAGWARSVDFMPLSVGSHTFYAVYLGDGNYKTGTSADEPLSMEKHGVTVVTTIMPSSTITLGDTVHDEVQVTGLASPFALPTGDVQFYLDGVLFDTVAIDSSGFAKSKDYTPQTVGGHTFYAIYLGDANYKTGTSADEPLLMEKHGVTVVTTIMPSSAITLGDTVHDEVQVTGLLAPFAQPTGFVQFYLDGVEYGVPVEISASGWARSLDFMPLSVGAHTFSAQYLGDFNYKTGTSADEPLSMEKHDVTVTTTIMPTDSITLGDTVHDEVQVTGLLAPFAQPTGDVQFYLDGVLYDTVAIDLSGHAVSKDYTPTSVGNHVFNAVYLGDSNYKTGTSADEPLSMEKHGVTVTTTIMPSSSITLGDMVHDEVQVTGLVSPFAQPTGYVQFYLDGVLFDTVAIDSSGFAKSKDFTPLMVGSHTFYAVYLGDSNYKTGTSADEPLSMGKHDVTVVTTIMPTDFIHLMDTVHDEVQVTGLLAPFAQPTGDVQFYLDGSPFGAPVAINAAGWARSLDFTPIIRGDHNFYAVYLGDDNYEGGTSANEPLKVIDPSISVTKSGPSEAHVGDVIIYTITVTNTGDCPLHDVTVVDSRTGTLFVGSLAAGESMTFYPEYTVTAASGDPVDNTVDVAGTDDLGRTVIDSASHSVDVLHPGIDVTKTGPAEAHEGNLITYTIVVTNTGDCPLYNVAVTDTLLGNLGTIPVLGVGGSVTLNPTYTIPTPQVPNVDNTVTAAGKDNLDMEVTDSASHSVDVLHPAIDVAKTGPAEAHEGDTITYMITVTNIGDCVLYDVVVTDTLLGPVGTIPVLGIGPANAVVFSPTYIVPTPQVPNVENTVTAAGHDSIGGSATDSADHSVDILHPGISVAKTGPSEAHEGQTITYIIVVTNTGDCVLTDVKVVDSLLGDLTAMLPDTTLDIGEVDTIYPTYTIPVPQVPNVDNTVTASGHDSLDRPVSASASHSVDVLHPALEVVKTGPPEAHEGQTITYTITVSNTGDCILYDVVVTDSLLGDIATIPVLGIGASESFDVSYTIPIPQVPNVDNTATATGHDDIGGSATDSDDHSVDVLHPALVVVKSGPAMAHEGDTITYTITVTNTGDCILYNVVVDDTLLGLLGTIPQLAVGGTATFTPVYVIPTPQVPNVDNTVTATGHDSIGGTATDSDSHSVDVLHPALDVVKIGPAEAHEGDPIMYTITVTNTGDCVLYDVVVTDSLLGPIGTIPVLNIGEVVVFTPTYVVPIPQVANVDNMATAAGHDSLGGPATDSDSHSVDVLHPAISLVKTGPAEAHEGDTITYTITVKNLGDCALYDVVVTDSLLGSIATIPVLGIGATESFDVTYTIPTPQVPNVVNTATVTGHDSIGGPVTDDDSHSVDVLHPAIKVTKSGPAEVHVGDLITYTITVTNTGDCPLFNVALFDDLTGPISVGDLGVGQSMTFHPTYTATDVSEDPLPNLVGAAGEDNLGRIVFGAADWVVDILKPAIDVQKTGPKEAHEGDIIGYVITVTNTGDCTLYDVLVTDSLLGSIGTIAQLEPGAANAVTFDVDYTIPTPQIPNVVNTATATGTDHLGLEVTDSASWSVDVLHPHITVIKKGPEYAHATDTIVYTITVENDGDCDLFNVVVQDPLIGVDLVLGDMHVSDIKTVTQLYEVPLDVETVHNTAVASGADVLGGAKGTVEAQDVWEVLVITPIIDVTKSGPTFAHNGDVITYTFVVTNVGDTTLYNVVVTDNVLGPIGSIAELDVGAANAVTLTKDYTVTIPSGDLTNTVTATGEDILGKEVSDTATHRLIVTIPSVVTDTQFCVFDMDPSQPGQQFRLIFTPTNNGVGNGAFKLASTNPGQFYYNVFFVGAPGDEVTIDVWIPYPFVTNGAMAIHAYEDYDTIVCDSGCLQYIQIGQIPVETSGTNTITTAGQYGISLNDYSPKAFGSSAVVKVTATVPSTGLIYITVHLEYGLKHSNGFYADKSTNAAKNVGPDGTPGTGDDWVIHNFEPYLFQWRAGSEWVEPTVYSENVFKKDPGIAGLVVRPSGEPVVGAKIEITDEASRVLGTAYTDLDGWYTYVWKYTGKPGYVVVKLPAWKMGTMVWMKSNSLVLADFVTWC